MRLSLFLRSDLVRGRESGIPYHLIRGIAALALKAVYFLFGGIRFEGRENVPMSCGVVVAANHVSDWDPPTIVYALPRACWVMAKAEIFTWPLIGILARWLHGFPVKRDSPDRTALRKAVQLLKQGEAVVIFPEGRTSKHGGLQPLQPGALFAARAAGAPIVPAVIMGTERLAPPGTRIPRPMGQPIVVRFGRPVTVEQLTGGLKGGRGLKRGAKRLGEIMQALLKGEHGREHSEAG